MQFLIDHFLHKNAFIITIDEAFVGDDNLITEAQDRIRGITDRHTMVLILYHEVGETYPTTIAI